jgi:type I restriction enzyme S subunit
MKRLHGWRTCQLGEVVQTYSGGTPNRSRPEFFGGSIPWIKSGELNQKWITSTEECITEEGLAKSAAKIVPAGSTLIALYGATAGVIGRTRIAAAINQAVLAVIPDRDQIDDNFLQYALNHIGASLLRLVQGAQPNLNAGLVKESEIDLPPLPEQQKIADVLGTWDAALEKLDALITANEPAANSPWCSSS